MKYLLAVDGSTFSEAAFAHLASIFILDKDSLVILYAMDKTIMDEISLTMHKDVVTTASSPPQALRADAEMVQMKYENLTSEKKIPFYWVQQDGTPIEVIRRYIADNKVGTLVLGTHGRGVLQRAVLGSVSTYFVQHAKVPTLVVPSGTLSE